MAEPQQNRPASAPSDGPQRIKVGVMPLFSTWIYQCEDGPRHLNQRLERLAHKLMEDDRNATRRTKYGGVELAFECFEMKKRRGTWVRKPIGAKVPGFLKPFSPTGPQKKEP